LFSKLRVAVDERNIACGKFDSKISIDGYSSDISRNRRIRIGSKNPNRLFENQYTPISTNGDVILCDGEIFNPHDFLISSHGRNLIVLTNKEKALLLDALIDTNTELKVFEVKYPVFDHIKYVSNVHKNYEELNRLLNVISELEIKGESVTHHASTSFLYKIERKLRYKNNLDKLFAFAYKGGYQEVFKLKEERIDRQILALDFNSMFADCMKGIFLEPKSVRYQNFSKESNINLKNLENGLYRVILKQPTNSFFNKYHPFKYVKLNNANYFDLEDNHNIELLLFKNELIFYQKYFGKVEVKEGFISKNSITHPLVSQANLIYSDRLKYKKIGDKIMENISKLHLITMHSSTNQKRFKYLTFKSSKKLIAYLSSKYMIEFPPEMSDEMKLTLIEDYNNFNFKHLNNRIQAKLRNFDSNDTVYSISAQILANSRIKMIRTIEKFLQHPSVEICYANIDSIHISILKSELTSFLQNNRKLISNKMGDLKIETIASKGYWFDVGRYWLINDAGDVDLFKNRLFNHKGTNSNFTDNRKLNIIIKGKHYSYVKPVFMHLFNAFSYNKKVNGRDNVDNVNYDRYSFNEISGLKVAAESYNREILKSKRLKIDLFKKIATV
jgi:hypothetical protein